ncbi:polysaccharide deacetylase family protein [Conexibacter woesei]|uniref:Polysaccharide deacetylase n=1 Tax=Conexibacter woesei (strain DSM 14684 / CCUG 47730 / CIP 108061 / JCM 11494 / NBRC 100937 / ID131577) TaxID=469383 RepID=D3F4Z4_CONWI|nr:polysaccharide deacetylase family protein [Conexibacter woesei]ADB48572.1 polysaccharide deacetylase [Conexibacter woesei DSM 14684]
MSGVPPNIVRRRVMALLVLVAALAVVVALVVTVAGGGDDDPASARADAGAAAKTTGARARGDGGRAGGGSAAGAAASPTAGRDMGRPGPPRPVPILMYHVTTDPPANAPFPDLYVRASEFADQMQALKQAGYVAVTQQELWDAWHRGGPLPARAVVVSIDDGYRSNYLNARPVLRRLGWPAVLNLKVGNLSEPEYGLTDGQVKELIADGWEIDSHTIDHPDLTTVDAATLAREVAESRAELQRRFGVPVNFFCYPAGRYDDTVIAAVERAGYLAATTVEPGLAQPDAGSPFALNRVRVNSGVSGASLVSQLADLGA